MQVNINGEITPVAQARISPLDRGYLYGDGIFETMRTYQGEIFKLAEHLDRLFASAQAIMLELPYTRDELQTELERTLAANDLVDQDAYLRLSFSRGESEGGIDPTGVDDPTLMVIAKPLADPQPLAKKCWEVVTVPTRRNHPETINPRIKSTNFLNNILAKAEAKLVGADDGIMLNQAGFVTEGTVSNIFIVKDGKLKTPPLAAGILAGVTRELVIDLANSLDIEVSEVNLTRHDLYTADEVLATVTTSEIIPITKVDGREIATGEVGKVTELLAQNFPRPNRE
ncbi:MAG: branched-chain-amino-acid transaminase [Bacillota bacterium]